MNHPQLPPPSSSSAFTNVASKNDEVTGAGGVATTTTTTTTTRSMMLRSAVTPSPEFQNFKNQNSLRPQSQSQSQSQSPNDIDMTTQHQHQQSQQHDQQYDPEIILRKYIQKHPALGEFDEETAFEICQGAAALCFMNQDIQVGIPTRTSPENVNDNDHGHYQYNLPTIPNLKKKNKRKRKNNGFRSIADSLNETDPAYGHPSGHSAYHSNSSVYPGATPYSLFSSSSSTKKSSSSLSSNSRKKPRRNATRLAVPSDAKNVNQLHAFVRSDLLEIFTVPNQETAGDQDDSIDNSNSRHRNSDKNKSKDRSTSSTPRSSITRSTSSRSSFDCGAPKYDKDISRSTRMFPGRVGFRCSFCADVPTSDQHTMASFHPKRLADLYRSGE